MSRIEGDAVPLLEGPQQVEHPSRAKTERGGLGCVGEQPLLGVQEVLGRVAGGAVLNEHGLTVRPAGDGRGGLVEQRIGFEPVPGELDRDLGMKGVFEHQVGSCLPILG